MDIPLGRQQELYELLEDNLWKLLCYHYFRTKQITMGELEWMVSIFGKSFPLPTWITGKTQETKEMSANSQVIVQRYEGKTIDEEFLKIVATERDEYCGFASPDKDGTVSISHMSGGEESLVSDIKSFMKDNEDYAIWCFGRGASTDESQQPFTTLTNDKGECICATFIDGDLQGFGAPETSHSIAFAAHQEYLMPKIIDIFTANGEDIEKTFAKLNSNYVKKEIINNLFPGQEEKTSGEVLILFGNGKFISALKGDKHKKYEWGETSSALGFESKATVPEKTSKFGKKTTATKTAETAISAAMTAAVEKKKTDDVEYLIVPPAFRHSSNQSLEEWYSRYGDETQKPSAEQFNEMKGAAHKAIPVKLKKQIANNPGSVKNLVDNKTIVLFNKDKATVAETKPDIPILIIPKGERENLEKEFWKKIAAGEKDLTVKPEDLVAFLKDKPTASNQLGRQMGVREFETFSPKAWEEILRLAPKTIVAIVQEQQVEIFKLSSALKVATETRKAM